MRTRCVGGRKQQSRGKWSITYSSSGTGKFVVDSTRYIAERLEQEAKRRGLPPKRILKLRTERASQSEAVKVFTFEANER